ncbi:HxlR family transcriptional regulator [Alteromonadaceae bacterium 2753L.S.0a.02]|nr:HxlR family transcriptional regulator [Alteromonadaceae bacterium 2753L.S.0a.02]
MQASIDKIKDCPVMITIKAIGGKWKPRILWVLRDGPSNFGTLCRATGASQKMLARSLSELVKAGLIERRETQQGEVKLVIYSYTPKGKTLIPVLDLMGQWGERSLEAPHSSTTHDDFSTMDTVSA